MKTTAYSISVASTPGEWQQTATDSQFDSAAEAIVEALHNGSLVYELGADELPEDVEDIRGRIHNQRGRIFAAVDGDSISYFGLVESLESEEEAAQ